MINYIQKIKSVLLLLLLFTLSLRAQQPEHSGPGKISGRIIDSISGLPVEYATISLLTQADDKVVNGTTTDITGEFKLTEIAEGNYKIVFDFIGYQRKIKNNVVIDKKNSEIVLGDIKLVSKQTKLDEVTIEAEQNVIENKIDKLVYNADKDITSQGGVASDILKKVPGVSVDVNGAVELQGNSNIRFLINGKPSSIFGNNLISVLQSIPASQIQSIEVITMPGAKYDAEGSAGIINIILKKNTAQGINCSMSLSGGTRLENGSLNVSARKGQFGVNAFFSGNGQINSTTLTEMDRISKNNSGAETSRLLQNGYSDFSRAGIQSGLSFDWTVNPKNTLTGAFNFNFSGDNNSGATNRKTILVDYNGNTFSDISNIVNSVSKINNKTFDWSLNYKKSFTKKGHELEFIYSSSYGNNFTTYNQTQKYITTDSVVSSSYGNNPGTDAQTNISINYAHPVVKDFLIETGVKTVLSQVNSVSNVYLENLISRNYDYNTSQSISMKYNRNIFAGYVSTTFKLYNFLDVKMGCRYEYTDTKVDFSNSGVLKINPYNTVVPSGVISHSFKNNHTLKLSYTRRIQRPDYKDLNPFINASDPKNITTGNPNLVPEFSNNIELGYSKVWKKGANINVALFYKRNTYDISAFTKYYSTLQIGDSVYTNVSVGSRANVGTENNFGMNLFASVPITTKLNLRGNISCFQRYILNIVEPGRNIQGFNYKTTLTLTYKINSGLVIEVFGNFNSPKINVQGIMPAFSTYNFAFRKLIFHNNGSIALTATNPFAQYVDQRTSLSGQNFTLTGLKQMPYRSFGFNFTYKFGKLEFKKQKEVEDVNLTNPPGGN